MNTQPRGQLIDGLALSQSLRAEVARDAQRLSALGVRPGLAVILVGDDPASAVYVRNKVKACADAGLHSVLERHPADLSEAALMARIAALNADATIHGILVQLPLPKHINAQRVIEAIAPTKDVDGFHVNSAGALMTGLPGFWPCTPYGCLKMLDSIGFDVRGKHAVVLDVGMNRNDEGKLCGDVDFAAVRPVASWITPVPGGVGPMTITMLLVNTIQAAEATLRA